MTIQENLNALGRWEIDLKPTIPRETLDALAYFGHVAIIQGRLDPARYGDNLLDVARYVGALRSNSFGDDARTKTPNDNVKIGGVGMAMWLGDEDNKGDVLENATTFASGSLFPDVIRGLLPASGAITEGTLYPVAGTYSGTHQWQSPRQAIQYVCQTMSTPSSPFPGGSTTTAPWTPAPRVPCSSQTRGASSSPGAPVRTWPSLQSRAAWTSPGTLRTTPPAWCSSRRAKETPPLRDRPTSALALTRTRTSMATA